MLSATPDGSTTGTINARQALVLAAAHRIAAALDEGFTGHVEIHIHQRGVCVVKVVQSFRGGKS
jgi:hypothetical protein